ncbi:MAG: Heparinase family protein [Haloplasmataceae bacterium]|jgi:hypothetical protein|nr:Heparinase family protein [Haloplasmataceae bacterium]
MEYLNEELLIKSINNNVDYQNMVDQLKIEVDYFCSTFSDDPQKISGWGHKYFCQDDGGRLIFDLTKPHSQKCDICGKEYTGDLYDSIWVYNYRNEAILISWKSALLYKITQEVKYLDYVKQIIGFYADHYLEFKLHNKDGHIYESLDDMVWGCGRLMPQGLNESLFIIRLVNALEIVKSDLGDSFISSVNEKLFKEVFKLLKPQVNKVHNIIAWNNSAIGTMGLFSNNEEMLDFVFKGEFNIRRQIREGVTSDGFWYEGSIHYNFFTLEGIINLLLFSKLYDFEFGEEELIIKNMLTAAYQYAFDNHVFPNPNDGWPDINLKTYSYVYTVATKIFGYDSEVANLLKNIENKNTLRVSVPLSKPYYFDNRIPLERLSLIPNLNMENYYPVVSTSKNFEQSQFGVIRRNNINVFLKYGHRGPSHAHPDKMTIEVMIGNKMLTRDLSNSGYGAILCNEWHRMSASHNTVIVNGKNQVSMEGGNTISFEEYCLHSNVSNVYSISNKIDIETMKNTMNEDEVIKYLVKNLFMTEHEAKEAIGSKKNMSEIAEEAILSAPKVNYDRKIQLLDNGFIDEFIVTSNQEVIFDYFFHSEADLLTTLVTEEYSLGFDENGFQHIKNVRKVVSSNKNLVLKWRLGEYLLESNIDLDDKELLLAETYDNPITKNRTSIVIRHKGMNAVYSLIWKII